MDPSVVMAAFKVLAALYRGPQRFFAVQVYDCNIFLVVQVADEQLAFDFIECVKPFDICSILKIFFREPIRLFASASGEALWPQIVSTFRIDFVLRAVSGRL